MVRILTLLAALFFTLLIATPAFAQDDTEPVIAPFAVDISQVVPAEVTLTLLDANGEGITTTIALSINVALRVEVSGPDIEDVVVKPVEPTVVVSALTLPTEEDNPDIDEEPAILTDAGGVSYSIIAPEGVAITKVEMVEALGRYEVRGEVTNNTDETISRATLTVSFFDEKGDLLETVRGNTAVWVEPGITGRIYALSSEEIGDVAYYVVTYEP